MRTNFVQTCKTSAHRINLNRTAMRVALIGLFISLGIGNAWAGDSNYYASLKINQSGPTGAGSVYVANSSTKPGTANPGTAVKSAATTTSGGNVTMYYWIDVNPGYNVSSTGKVEFGLLSSASKNGSVSCAASTTADGTKAYTATATFVAVTVDDPSPETVNIAPTNPSIDYPFTVTFATSYLKTIALDLNKSPETVDGKFTITSWAQDGDNVVATGKFNGGGSYGGASRNNSTTVSLQSKASGSTAKTCTVTANFPALAFVGVEATEVFATQGESGKTGSATFTYNYGAEDDFPTTPTLTHTSGSGSFSVTGYTVTPNFSTGVTTVTVNYEFNTNNGVGETVEQLKLTAANGQEKTVTITGHSEALATDDAKVTKANGDLVYQGDWATALTNQADGYTITLLRNVAVTAAATFSKTITLDLNGKTLSGTVNNMLTINGTGKTLTIKDSKTGGAITTTTADNATRSVISLAKGKLKLESGLISMNATNTGSSVVARGVTMASGTTFDMEGGRIESISAGQKPVAVYVIGTFNMSGGVLSTSAGTTTAYTLWINNGTANVTGGTITSRTTRTGSAAAYMDNAKAVLNVSNATLHGIADANNLTAAGDANAYGVYNYTAGGTINVNENAKIKGEANNESYGRYGYGIVNRVANCIVNVSNSPGIEIMGYSHYQYAYGISNAGTVNVYGGTIKAETDPETGKAYAYALSTSGTANIYGGNLIGISNTSDARAINTSGTTIIEDAELSATTTTSGAYGLYVSNKKTTATNVTIQATATTSDAHGVCILPGNNKKTGAKTEPEVILTNVTSTAKTGTKTASAVTALSFRRLITSTESGYTPGDYLAKCSLTINGGTYTAIATTTAAYGAFIYKPSYIADGSENAIIDATISNAKFIAKTTGANNSAYGIRTGGTTTINGCNITAIAGAGEGETPAASNSYGILIDDQKTTVSNTTVTSKALTGAYGMYVNAIVFSSSADASRWPTYGYEFSGEAELNEANQFTAQTTGGNTSYAIYVHAAKAAVASGVLAGDHACAGEVTINGGKYTASASGTTAYAACVADPVLQGEATATPTLIINGGKFKGTAGAAPFADVSVNGEPGYFVLNGGYYVKDENLDKKLGEGMNKVAVKSGTPEYTEGYRWRVTDNMTGEYVCKIKENSTSYASLEEALQVVNADPTNTWTIIMIANYTLSKGDYVLPAKTTLLIPYQSGQTAINGANPKFTYPKDNVEIYEAPTPLYKLTFANGVNMSVYGKIEASAVTYLSNQGLLTHGTGVVSGKYGWLYLNEGSHIDLESGSALYAWGYVTGKGEINAKNGSAVYEDFQMGDWRGGTVESNFLDNKTGLDKKGVFVITHYYYQNIECPITYRAGAQGLAHGGTYMYNKTAGFVLANDPVPTTEAVKMIGTSGAMFLMDPATAGEDTWVRKEYDAETDYVNWTMNSGAKLGSVSIHMDLPMLGAFDVNSADYVLPITSNFNIVANYGEIDITNHVCFLPGSKLTIKKEGVVNIPSGQRVFFYDQDDWKSYGGYWFNPGYSPSWKVNPRVATIGDKTKVKMSDAEVLVEGLLNVNGAIYTTAGGANIHSTRENAGKVKFGAALPASTSAIATSVDNKGNTTTLFQITSAPDNKPSFEGKALNSAWLKNEDGTYSKPTSANTSAGDTWTYMQSLTEDTYEWTLASEDGCFTTRKTGDTKTYVHPSDWVAVGAVNANHAYPSEDGTRMFVNTEAASTSASCKWWDVNPTPEVIDGTTYYVANNDNFDNFGTYYYWDNTTSYWKPKKITVTWQNEDGTKITNGTYGDLYSFNTSPQFHGTNPKKTSTAIEKYDWIGWRDAEGNIYDKNATLPRATSDVTYTAYFNTTKYQYTITFKNDDNSDLWAGLVDAGTTGAELQALFELKYNEKTGTTIPQKAPTVDKVYTFSSWNTSLATVTAAATYTANYTWVTRKYHVTFYNYDAVSVLYEADVNYNTAPTYSGVTPFRANTSAFSYDWTGWQQGATTYTTSATLPVVKGDISYIATFEQTELKYQVFFKRQDGSIIDAPFFTYEETPSAFPADPTMASTASTDYTFREWSPATLVPVTEDGKVYTALFDESVRQYTAHFVNYNGVSLNVDQTIDYNTVPAYTGATPFHPNDSRNSYEFSGWAWAAGDDWEAGSIGIGEAFPAIKGDITFTAQFNPVLLQFNVIYQREDGTFIKQDKVKWGQDTEAPAAADCNYEDEQYTYTLSGWSPAIVNPVTTDATYTAQFNHTPRSYSVTLNTNGGTINAGNVTSYTYGTGATLPTNVTRTGYGFSGWYDNSGLTGSAVTNISSTATGNKTYWAKWTAATYNLTYEGLNGATNSNPSTYTIETATITLVAPGTREGYTFTGWTCGGSPITQIALGSTGDKTITANWSAVTYNLTYEGLNGATNSNPSTYTIETATITLVAPGTRSGYTFTGWTCGGDPITQITLGSTGDKTITANWSAVTYNLTYEGLNGATNSNPSTYTIETATITLVAPGTRSGYTFTGWTCGGDPITQIAIGSTGDKTITANWSAVTYSVRFNKNDEDATGTMPNESFTYDVAKELTSNAFTKTGYNFAGWATSAGGNVVYTDGQSVSNLSATQGAVVDMYAKWTVATYEVALNANGGTGGSTSVTMTYNSVDHTAITNPTRTGYTFHSWNTTASSSTRKQVISSKGVMSENVSGYTGVGGVWIRTTMPTTLYARWSQKSYITTFTHNGNGSISYNGAVVDAGGTAKVYHVSAKSLVATPNTGYHFTGWTVSGTNASKVTIADLSAASTTIKATAASATVTAGFAPDEYTISYKDQGDAEFSGVHGSGYPTTHTYGTATVLVSPTKEGYTFDGWYDNAECTGTALTEIGATDYTADFTLYAKWTAAIADRELDIVDWTSNSITINVTNLKAESGTNKNNWAIRVNDTDYPRKTTTFNADRTLTVTDLSLTPNENLLIQLKNDADVIESQHNYTIPFIYTSTASLSEETTSSSVVYVYGGKLTISDDITLAALYVCPGAEVEVTDGNTLTVGKLVLRTKPWATAAISGSVDAANTYYTRIAPDGSSEYPTGQYYQFGLPYECAISAVRLSDGTTPAYNTTWILKSYNEEKRATNGATGENWDVLSSGTIAAGRGYEMFSSYKYYREYYFPVTPTENTSVSVTRTTEDTKGSTEEGWNIVCSPLMSTYTIDPEPEGWMISWLQEDGFYSQEPATTIKPAIPFSYQAEANGSLSFDSEFSVVVTAAPRRRVPAAEEPERIQWIHLDILNADGVGDQTSIYSHPTRYEQTYKTGIDVAKQSLTASRAIIYSSHAYGEMAFAGVSDALLEAGISLTVYSPAAQELTFSLRDNEWLDRMAAVWLVDMESGAAIDLLDSDYSYGAAAGTTAGRFIIQGRFRAPEIATDIENEQSDKVQGIKVRKIMYREKLYILIGDQLYDATGKMVDIEEIKINKQ